MSEKLQAIRAACERSVANGGAGAVTLTIGRPCRRNARTIRLTPHGGPVGQVLDDSRDYQTLAMFDAAAVLKFLDKHGR